MDPSFGQYWKQTRERLDAEFEAWLPRFFDRLPSAHVAAVGEVLRGGKRLRACLVCLLNEVLGGTWAAALPRALAVECVQAASLIHDDWIDGDTSRRDRAATWTLMGPRRAVLLGDLMFATALHRMAEVGRDDVQALAEAIATMATGAWQEQDPRRDATDLYPKLIYLKTGVLFGTAARLGALAAGSSAPMAALAFEYGARTGEAYQIADDWQDMIEPPAPGQRSAMQAAIETRLQRAMAAADQLAVTSHRELLRTAPREIVRTMWADAP